MPVLNCLSQHHSLLVACFVTATSQHHAALALSCALLCLSITLLLLSHVPCFVSASRCSCFLMCLALSQHHAALAFSCALLCLSITLHSISCRSYSHVPSFVSVLLSQVLWFVSASLTPFLLSLMCLICLSYRSCSCALLCLNITPLLLLTLSQGITLLFKCSLCALLCLASASRCSLRLKCFTSASRRSCALPCLSMTSTPLFSALPFPLDIFQATRSIAPRCYKVVQWIRN